jgi:protein SCO1
MIRHTFPPVLAAVLSAMVVAVWACSPARPTPSPLNGATLEPSIPLPPLTFTRADGEPFSTADARGRTSLFFFGYTQCAEVCPLTLAHLGQIRRSLGSTAGGVDLYFVTLDPSHDTPERMRAYLANFPGVVGLIGSTTQLAAAQSAFGVIADRREVGSGNYLLDHTGALYLINSAAQVQMAYPYGTPPEDIVSDVRRIIQSVA